LSLLHFGPLSAVIKVPFFPQSLVDWCAIYPFTNASYYIALVYLERGFCLLFGKQSLSFRGLLSVCPVKRTCPGSFLSSSGTIPCGACPFTKTFDPGPPNYYALTPSLGFTLTLLHLLRNSVYDPGFGVDSSQFATMLRLAPALIFAYLATSAVAADDDFTPPNCSLDEHCPEKYPCCSGMSGS
jgi:hypothetical protein